MHCACLGTVKGLISIKQKGGLTKQATFGQFHLLMVNERLEIYKGYIPYDSQRLCRISHKVGLYKANDFPLILLLLRSSFAARSITNRRVC